MHWNKFRDDFPNLFIDNVKHMTNKNGSAFNWASIQFYSLICLININFLSCFFVEFS